MLSNQYVTEQIKASVKMGDVLERYGLKVGRSRRIPCPFHGGKDNNLGFRDDFFHCFVCGAKGDIFEFVMKFFNIPFVKAAKKLCEDFGLPYGNCASFSPKEREELVRKSEEVKKQRKIREFMRRQLEDDWWGLFWALQNLEDNKFRYAPKIGDVRLHPLYKIAIDNVEAMRYELIKKEEEIKEFECGEYKFSASGDSRLYS